MMVMKLVELLLAKPSLSYWNEEERRLFETYSEPELAIIFQSIQDQPASDKIQSRLFLNAQKAASFLQFFSFYVPSRLGLNRLGTAPD